MEGTTLITADFVTFEDLSSRLVLLPYNDDDCTGAKVCSLDVSVRSTEPVAADDYDNIGEQTSVQEAVQLSNSEAVDEVVGDGMEATHDVTATGTEQPNREDNKSDPNNVTNSTNVKKKRGKKKKKRQKPSAIDSQSTSAEEVKSDAITPAFNGEDAQTADADSDETKEKLDAVATVSENNTNHSEEDSSHNTAQVPAGFVLVKIHGGESKDTTADNLEEMDFSDLLSSLRDASYPLSLSFASPTTISDDVDIESNAEGISSRPISTHDSDGDEVRTSNDADGSPDEEISEPDPSDDAIDPHTQSGISSREEAAKYAKEAASQAASELRGRLSRWGFQAATRAAEAASAVQELREERQRKLKEEAQKQHHNGIGDNDNGEKPSDPEKTEGESPNHNEAKKSSSPTVPPNGTGREAKCSIFIQTTTGFVELPESINESKEASKQESSSSSSSMLGLTASSFSFLSQHASPPLVTNTSVISVRLTADNACPVNKDNGYSFQWYRAARINDTWHTLSGACYAAYQPSASDVGHLLRCVIKHGGSMEECVLQYPVNADPVMFDAGVASLLKDTGKNTATFGSLSSGDFQSEGRQFRLRVVVERSESEDNISGSGLFIEQTVDGSMELMQDETEPITNVHAVADPSKPRSFELVFRSGLPPSASALSSLTEPSNGRLRLDASNRKAREACLVAIGIANFRGNLSSLSTSTALFGNSIDSLDNSTSVIAPVDFDISGTEAIHNLSSASPKNLHAIQLEAQLGEMKALIESKDGIITKLQQRLAIAIDERTRTEKELMSSRISERQTSDALEQCKLKLQDKEEMLDTTTKDYRAKETEKDRALKSLENDNSVLSAVVEARDGKIVGMAAKIKELEESLSQFKNHAEEVRKRTEDEARAKRETAEAEAVIAAMKREEHEFQQELKSAKAIIDDINQKYSSTKSAASKSKEELERLRSECRKLKMERNSLKHKTECMAKEMSRIHKNVVNEEEVEQLRLGIKRLQKENSELQDEITLARSEKRDALDNLQVTRLAHEQSVRYQQKFEEIDGIRAVAQCAELERVISEMTEYTHAQAQKITSLIEINESLMREIESNK